MQIKHLIRENVKDEYGILKLQNVILNIMQSIDVFCRKYGIEYYIIGGSALGARRHGGFIPWDDDLDIAMTRKHYDRFCELCRTELSDEFYYQEGGMDWPIYFSKVRLKGTFIEEIEGDYDLKDDKKGIYVDVFPLDNVPNGKLQQLWWYVCGKMLVAHSLKTRGYKSASFGKKVIMFFTIPLNVPFIRRFFLRQVKKYNSLNTNYIGGFSLVSRFSNTFAPKSIWGKPKDVPFETIQLMAPADLDGFLTFYFGDFMQLPPEEKRQGKHLLKVDYGKYDI